MILQYILEIEDRKLYTEMGYDGMYTYLTRGLGYSEASAYRRLQAARLLKQLPDVSQKLQEGSLNLSQLTKVQKCLKEQKQKSRDISGSAETLQVLEKIQNKNSFETEKILALEFNQPIQTHEKIKPQKDNSVRLEITLTEEQFAELEQAKSLLSHICPDGNWSEIITALAKIYNKKKLKGRSTQSIYSSDLTRDASAKTVNAENDIVGFNKPTCKPPLTFPLKPTSTKRRRRYISVKTKRLLLAKARYCCEYQNPNTGKRCGSKYQLELDHIQPWTLSGSNEIENLRVLCKKHNNLVAVKLGLKFFG